MMRIIGVRLQVFVDDEEVHPIAWARYLVWRGLERALRVIGAEEEPEWADILVGGSTKPIERHWIPLNDGYSHDASDDCLCGPEYVLVESTEETDEPDVWVFTHQALDGQERNAHA